MNFATDRPAILTVGVQMGTQKNLKFFCSVYAVRQTPHILYWSPLSHAHAWKRVKKERMQRPLIDPVPGPVIQRMSRDQAFQVEKEKKIPL
jgi:hypothetical protein